MSNRRRFFNNININWPYVTLLSGSILFLLGMSYVAIKESFSIDDILYKKYHNPHLYKQPETVDTVAKRIELITELPGTFSPSLQTPPDTVFVENFHGQYDIRFIKYSNCVDLTIGVFDDKKQSYSADYDVLFADDLRNTGGIDYISYCPKGRQHGVKDGELKSYNSQEKLSALEKGLLAMIK